MVIEIASHKLLHSYFLLILTKFQIYRNTGMALGSSKYPLFYASSWSLFLSIAFDEMILPDDLLSNCI
jgi:hypothetical protein